MNQRLMLAASLAALWGPLPFAAAAAQSRYTPVRWGQIDGPPAITRRATMMRAGPEAGYPQVRRIRQGEQLQLFGCLDDRSWCDVGHGNDRGWITGPDLQASYRGRRDSIANLYDSFQMGSLGFSIGNYWDDHYRQQPFYGERNRWEQHYFNRYQSSWGPRPRQSYWGNQTVTGYMQNRSWVLAGPHAGYPRLGLVSARSQVLIHGCLRDWSWCDISYRTNRGWVNGRNIAGTWQGRRQTISSIAPYLGVGVLSFTFGNYWNEHYRAQPFYHDRDRWERQYVQNYRPSWGPGPYQSQQAALQWQQQQAQRTEQREQLAARRQQVEHDKAERKQQKSPTEDARGRPFRP